MGVFRTQDMKDKLTALAHAQREASGEYRRGYLAALHDVAISVGARFPTPPPRIEDATPRLRRG